MISITERLRARHEPVGDGTGTWRPDGLCQEAADFIDALLAALETVEDNIVNDMFSTAIRNIDDAIAKAKGEQE